MDESAGGSGSGVVVDESAGGSGSGSAFRKRQSLVS